jgi:hypothetical protein
VLVIHFACIYTLLKKWNFRVCFLIFSCFVLKRITHSESWSGEEEALMVCLRFFPVIQGEKLRAINEKHSIRMKFWCFHSSENLERGLLGCNIVCGYMRFEVRTWSHALKMGAAGSYKMLVTGYMVLWSRRPQSNFYQDGWFQFWFNLGTSCIWDYIKDYLFARV